MPDNTPRLLLSEAPSGERLWLINDGTIHVTSYEWGEDCPIEFEVDVNKLHRLLRLQPQDV